MTKRISGYTPEQWVNNENAILVLVTEREDGKLLKTGFFENRVEGEPEWPLLEENGDYWFIDEDVALGENIVELSSSKDQIKADSDETVDIKIELLDRARGERDVTLSIDGTGFNMKLEPGVKQTETIKTSKKAGTKIKIQVDGLNVRENSKTIEVV
jgi:hypothetical protein